MIMTLKDADAGPSRSPLVDRGWEYAVNGASVGPVAASAGGVGGDLSAGGPSLTGMRELLELALPRVNRAHHPKGPF